MGNRPFVLPLRIQESRESANRLYVQTLSGTGTHNPSVRVVQDCYRLRHCGY
jgi:hypothetical protein